MSFNTIKVNSTDTNYTHSIFDISDYNSGSTYNDLSAALSAIPESKWHGGMTICYETDDNKYVQYRLMSDTFNTTPANWQGVDAEPTAGSNNLVKSGGVYNAVKHNIQQFEDDSNAELNVGDNNGNVILQLKNGHIRTKRFDSSNILKAKGDNSDADLNIGDNNGNVILQLKNGHIRTKNFNSDSYGNRAIKFATFGDSITSNYVTNTAGRVKEILGVTFLAEDVSDGSPAAAGNVTTEFGNLACGWSTCSDIEESGVNISPIHLLKCPDGDAYQHPENVLSNQVRRLLQHTTPLGQNIQWTHPLTGITYTIDGATYGYGKGYIEDIPDIIYIASSTNDNNVTDDYETVIQQDYDNLTRTTIASALRWAVETLMMNYPGVKIYVCTPIYRVDSEYRRLQTLAKREIIIKICSWLGIDVIDQTYGSGIGVSTGSINRSTSPYKRWLTLDGCHPNSDGREISAQFIAGRIKAGYGSLI